MANGPDMTVPVTRGELHEALDIWGGALTARIEAKFDAKLEAAVLDLGFRIESSAAETRAVMKTFQTAMITAVAALLDPYRALPARVETLEGANLPTRVHKLEAKVFAPKRRATKTTRRRRAS